MPSSCKKHNACIKTAMEQAEIICKKNGSRLTTIRKRVLELVWAKHEPMKAYDLLSDLQKDDKSAKPPTVYRALDFLLEHGLIHKIHRLNAYVGCIDPNEGLPFLFLICTKCQNVTEIHDEEYSQLISKLSSENNFTPKRASLEIEGTCSKCA